jgi:hypothetical protein
VTESLLKRYGLPLVVLSPIATGAVFVAYMGHGRFDMPRHAPLLDLHPPVLDVEDVTTADASEQEPPMSVPLPTPSGVTMHSARPSGMADQEAPPPALDAPLVGPVDRFPAELFAPPVTD